MDVTFKGLRELKKEVQKLARRERALVGKLLREEAQQILASSQEIVPVDTGALKASGKVSEVTHISDVAEIKITYGSDQVGYAQYVHELHAVSPKFLERPTMQSAGSFARKLVDKLNKENK